MNVKNLIDLNMLKGVSGVQSIEPDHLVSVNYKYGPNGPGFTSRQQTAPSVPLNKRTDNLLSGPETMYSIDTGIRISHASFEGRARYGKNFVDPSADPVDGNCHGTHTAATAVGNPYGVARNAHIVGVKVLDDQGSGSTSNVIAGVDWACMDASKNPAHTSIITVSLGGSDPLGLFPFLGPSATSQAVKNCVEQGVHFTVAAGNDNILADFSTPANVAEANTIGSINGTQYKSSFSNYGRLIDLWAPGENITSAWCTSDTATMAISGTSMATPHVAGIGAKMLEKYGPMSPDVLSQQFKEHAAKVVKFDVDDTAAKATSNNLLAQEW